MLLMEKQQYILNLPLKQIALRKLAIVLWQQADILALVKSFRCRSLINEDSIWKWRNTVEKAVIERIPMLLLPDSLEEELGLVIKPIGPEILKWKMHHKSLISNSNFTLDQLSWTSVGKVDYRKTAEILIRQERINIISRYKLACLYCLEDDIRKIWWKLSEKSKKLFYAENILQIRQPELAIFWSYLIREEVSMLDVLISRDNYGRECTLYQWAFERAAESGNKAATEYFFEKLTFEEREASLLRTALAVVTARCMELSIAKYDFPKENLSDVLCYLLSQMEQEEQIKIFNSHSYLRSTLRCFMDWPWQDLFMKVVEHMWSFLSEIQYELLMLTLVRDNTMAGYNYPKLFGELFLLAPSHYRKYMIDKHRGYMFWFRDLVYGSHTETIKLVLRNIDDKDRQNFIICATGLNISRRLIEEGKWFLLELFVSECRLSNEAKTILKSRFMDHLTHYYKEGQIKWRKRKWERFFKLIDNANVNDGNKRIIEEAEKEDQSTSNKPKRKRMKRRY